MDQSNLIVSALYHLFLNRKPRLKELKFWSEKCLDLSSVAKMIPEFSRSKEFVEKHGVSPGHPIGHYYSPVVNVATLDPAKFRVERETRQIIPALELNLERQKVVWREITAETPDFAVHATEAERFYLENPVYSYGDAVVLCGMINRLRPRRIIEIGSGFSSACMLDHIERKLLDTRITFVEPY